MIPGIGFTRCSMGSIRVHAEYFGAVGVAMALFARLQERSTSDDDRLDRRLFPHS
ncbi:hypothetical protein SCOR_18745 [Sulfidibacter corallicola]